MKGDRDEIKQCEKKIAIVLDLVTVGSGETQSWFTETVGRILVISCWPVEAGLRLVKTLAWNHTAVKKTHLCRKVFCSQADLSTRIITRINSSITTILLKPTD